MNKPPADTTALPRWMGGWERFWFTPADPTLLGLIRICCGAIALYTFIVYSFSLQDMVGPDGWVGLYLREELAHDRPILVGPLSGDVAPPPDVESGKPREYFEAYQKEFGMDLRAFGLKAPENDEQWNYLVEYTRKWRQPPPAYARDAQEARAVDEYRAREGVDPRLLYARGSPIWSVWMHVTDPTGMAVVQGLFIAVAALFLVGLGTRVTSALTWFAALCYIHRNPNVLFGADTMMTVLLCYLTIGPSGAALSLDRLLLRWWRRRSGVADVPPAPSVSANVAIRLLQIHLCIIYFIAGTTKLQGGSWWTGNALWGVLANFEFAPMQMGLYNDVLRYLCRDQLRFELVMTAGCYFTLAFEIGYIFLVWWPRTRWLFLGGAILLHGTIGMFMGLKTFSLLMLVMNMAFLRPEEVRWMVRLVTFGAPARKAAAAPAPALQAVGGAGK